MAKKEIMKKDKKKFGQTAVGKFLKTQAPDLAGDLLGLVGDVTGVGMLSTIGDKIKGSDKLTPSQKETALELLKIDIAEMEEVTKRWESDMASDSWLSKNVRPLVLLYLVVVVSVFAVMDSISSEITFTVAWINLFSSLLLTVIVAYFGSRGAEKYKKIGN